MVGRAHARVYEIAVNTVGTQRGLERRNGVMAPRDSKRLLAEIVGAYDSRIIRAYCLARFTIININILHILALCLRDKHKILDIGCGFGLFGCYFSALSPGILYHGVDLDSKRIYMARQTAERLGLHNATFQVGDARELSLNEQYDAVMTIDLLHHIDDNSKHRLLSTCARHLNAAGRLIIKDVTTQPAWKMGFTWVLDALLTRGFDMWYWDEEKFEAVLGQYFGRLDTFPIADWLPYPHIVYLCEGIRL
jgi:2-polyprenyl-3-methyl-5-hydroxy-6-metoxy-1,4-benzoquinol methylase